MMKMIKWYQLKFFIEQLHKSLDQIESITYDDEFIVMNGLYFRYKVITYDSPTNYSYQNNCLYINPKNVNDSTLLNIFIKKAYRHRKVLPF